MRIAEFESVMIKHFAAMKRAWSGRGPVATLLKVRGNRVSLVYVAQFTNFELYLLGREVKHGTFDDFLKEILEVMRGDFTPLFGGLHEGLKIDDMKTYVTGDNFRIQTTSIVLNKDLRKLVMNDQVKIPS
ncbi:hypothetical protein SAMN04487969_119100 [Paenibacillus algorifonticola]|uniref:Uncharacterized protein n=1 Tax=Paenibacillus algorifonticola TaxID=684063 RepID=A0A1I2H3C4_9BACL|nr:hypothetical protein [Paenibacillus algorifonticola]SFF23477.1 hypothetical protein SAMN04487969_119100 [Paenibacillus algorifonticola]